MKIKNSSSSAVLIGLIFAIAGIIVIIIGLIGYKSAKDFEETAVKTEGVVTDVDTHKERRGSRKHRKTVTVYDLTIEYEVGGQTYSTVIDNGTNSRPVGSTFELLYDPLNPSDAREKSSSTVILITGILGGIFTLAGTILFISNIKKSSSKKRLLTSGIMLKGVITNVTVDTSVRVNGRNPVKAECEVVDPQTGEKYLYSSDGVFNGLDSYIGAQVDVYVDPDDRSKSYVDLESIDTGAVGIHDYR